MWDIYTYFCGSVQEDIHVSWYLTQNTCIWYHQPRQFFDKGIRFDKSSTLISGGNPTPVPSFFWIEDTLIPGWVLPLVMTSLWMEIIIFKTLDLQRSPSVDARSAPYPSYCVSTWRIDLYPWWSFWHLLLIPGNDVFNVVRKNQKWNRWHFRIHWG